MNTSGYVIIVPVKCSLLISFVTEKIMQKCCIWKILPVRKKKKYVIFYSLCSCDCILERMAQVILLELVIDQSTFPSLTDKHNVAETICGNYKKNRQSY